MTDRVRNRFNVCYNTKKGYINCPLGHKIKFIYGDTFNDTEKNSS